LEPLASHLNDSPAAEVSHTSPLDANNILATEAQLKMRQVIYETNKATYDEVVAASNRLYQLQMEHAAASGGVDVSGPAWATQLQNSINSLTTNVNDLTTNVNDLTAKVNTMSHRLEQQEEKLRTLTVNVNTLTTNVDTLTQTVNHPTNGLKAVSNRLEQQTVRNINQSSIRTYEDRIRPIPNPPGGGKPKWMPKNNYDIAKCRKIQASSYLRFYNLPTGGSLNDKRKRIREHIGITI
jgi:chromosome segregation ATPase